MLLRLSDDDDVACTEDGLGLDMLCVAVGVALSDGIDETTSSANSVVAYPFVERTELPATVHTWESRVVSVLDVSEEAVEPSLAYDEWSPVGLVE